MHEVQTCNMLQGSECPTLVPLSVSDISPINCSLLCLINKDAAFTEPISLDLTHMAMYRFSSSEKSYAQLSASSQSSGDAFFRAIPGLRSSLGAHLTKLYYLKINVIVLKLY